MFDAQGVTFPSPPPPPGWVHTIGFTANQSEYMYGIDTDSSGNVYTLAQAYNYAGAATYNDAAIIKWDVNGARQWVRVWNSTGYTSAYDYGQKLYVDRARNCLYVIGHGYGVQPGYPTYYRPWILKLDLNGNLIWQRYIVDTAYQTYTYYCYYTDIAVDSSGNPCLVFYQSGVSKNYIVKLNASTGALVWATTYATNGTNTVYTSGRALATDSAGNVFYEGYGYSSSTYAVTLVLKLNSSGTFQWDRYIGYPTSYMYPMGIAVDAAGDVYAGSYGYYPAGGWSYYDWVLTKLNGSSGARQWAQRYGEVNLYEYRFSYGNGVFITPTGNVALIGETSTSGPIGLYDAGWVYCNASTGALVNGGAFGSSNYDYSYDQAWSSDNLPLIAGYATNASGWDFVAKDWPNSAITPNVAAWNGTVAYPATVTSTAISSSQFITPSNLGTLDTGYGGNDALVAKMTTLTP